MDTIKLLADKVNMNSQVLLSGTVTIVAVEVDYALLELCYGADKESPLAHVILEGLCVSYWMASLSEADLYIILPKFSIQDNPPNTKAEMRLMLGSCTDFPKQMSPERSGDLPNSTMFLMDGKWRLSSQSFVVRVQQPRILFVPDFLLGLSPSLQLIADAVGIDEYIYDGCGKTICVLSMKEEKDMHLSVIRPIIKTLRFVNVKFENGLLLRKYIYLSNDSSYSVSMEDGVEISFLDDNFTNRNHKDSDYFEEVSQTSHASDTVQCEPSKITRFSFEVQCFMPNPPSQSVLAVSNTYGRVRKPWGLSLLVWFQDFRDNILMKAFRILTVIILFGYLLRLLDSWHWGVLHMLEVNHLQITLFTVFVLIWIGGDLRRSFSIWRPIPRLGYATLGDCITEGLEPPPFGIIFKADDPEISAKPVQFTKVAHIGRKGPEEAFFFRACTFLAHSDLKKPPTRLPFAIGDAIKPKTRDNITSKMKIRCFSLTVLDSLCGMMTPLFDATVTNIKLASHGRLEAMNAVLVSSFAASTCNIQLEAWEPLVEPFEGIFKMRIAATSALNNISGPDASDPKSTPLALDEDDFQTVIVENKLGCDIYLKKTQDNFVTVNLLRHDDYAALLVPPLRYSDRLNVLDESREPRCHIAVQIFEAKGMAKLEVEVTNLAAKAGKVEVVGACSFSVGHGTGLLRKVASVKMLHQMSDVQSVTSYLLKSKGQHIDELHSHCLLSVSTSFIEKSMVTDFDKKWGYGKNLDGDMGFWVGLGPEGPWDGFRSLLPLAVIPRKLKDDFVALKLSMKDGKKHAVYTGILLWHAS
ncbi:hypothetical protein CASFOL_017073 [Castilleja foliolosa]|uniref:Uncharacterized protein n=1 Tax=Castilleja foliolosa TaxID=1961234 RepID=A0ABD3DC50_9LAMI